MNPLRHAEFEPKLISVLREGYSSRQLPHDLAAGIQVGIARGWDWTAVITILAGNP